ncbi:MAG: tetrahydrofolate dehydrogenase/cyclohydrolase catalytic domain-containing protein [Patescibacteria group bacterium]
MIVKGTPIAKRIRLDLKQQIVLHALRPHLVIIRANKDTPSELYISRKVQYAEEIGVRATVLTYDEEEQKKAQDTIQRLNADHDVHGIIVQLPVYSTWPEEEFVQMVESRKDVDGFKEDSPFTEATAMGIWEMLSEFAMIDGFDTTEEFLQGKQIVVLGRGRTAGQPTMHLLEKKGLAPVNVNSETPEPDAVIRQADVVISAVGKKDLLHAGNTKEGAYVIGLGIDNQASSTGDGIFGDINEEEISRVARLYCPIRNGIGPLTVVSLLKNVVLAAEQAQH